MRLKILPPPDALLDFFRKHESFVVLGHREPDGDCVGSQLTLASILRGMGKRVCCCSDGPFKRTEVVPYREQFSSCISETDKKNSALVIVDC